MIALFSITFAVSFFAMLVFYYHLQYPYSDLEKFKLRSHKFVKFIIVPAVFTLNLGLDLGLKLGFTSINTDYLAFILAAIPFTFIFVFLRERKCMYTQLSSKSIRAD